MTALMRIRFRPSAPFVGFIDDDGETSFIDDDGVTSFIDDNGVVG